MSAFKALRDVSNHFEYDLQQVAVELFSAIPGFKFEDSIEKKMKDLALFSSKLKLLKAKTLSSTAQVLERTSAEALEDYGDIAVWKVLEQATTKSLTQAHAVKALITTPDTSLDNELIEKKEAIIDSLTRFSLAECQLRHLNNRLREKEDQHTAVRAEWDHIIGEMRDMRDQQEQVEEDCRGPLYGKLNTLVEKLELMRWLIGRLVDARGAYDWLAESAPWLALLPLTRQHHTVDLFTQST